MKKECILVLGMHRSGTSALTKVLNILGAELPSKLLPPVENNNALGFFEPKDISALHDNLLASADSAWDDIRPFPPSWYSTDNASYYQNEIIKILDRDFNCSELFVIKDPRVCRIVPFWKSLLEKYDTKPKFLLTVRNPLEVIRSLENRDGFSAKKSVLLWLNHFIEAERETRGLDRAFTTYFHLLEDWKSTVENISNNLELTLPTTSTEIDKQVNEFLSPELRHHSSSLEELLNDEALVCWVKDVYQWVIDKVNGKNPSSRILDDILSEMTNSDVAYGRLYKDLERSLAQALEREKALEVEFSSLKHHETMMSKQNKSLRLSVEFLNEKKEEILTNSETLIASTNQQKSDLQEDLNRLFNEVKNSQYNKTTKPGSNVIFSKLGKLRETYTQAKVKKTIEQTGRFDREWYLKQYHDVEISGLDPLSHYLEHGVSEGRNPNASFDTLWYLKQNTDVLLLGMNPLYHYIVHGEAEGRQQNEKATLLSDTNLIESSWSRSEEHESDNSSTILLCAHSVGGTLFGGERSFLDMVEGASNLGYNVVVTLPSNNNQSYYDALKIHAQKIIVFPYSWWCKGREVDGDVVSCFQRIIQDNKINVVHVNTIMLREPLVAARKLSVPSIAHVRELISFDPDLCQYIGESPDIINEQVKMAADYIFANSFTTAKCVSKPEATFVVPNTVDTTTYDMENIIDPNDITVALISSNIPKKGVTDFIDIAKQLKHLQNVRFLLVGPVNDYIYELIQEQLEGRLPNNIEFTGYFDSPVDAIAKANIVLNLSAFQESFGRTVAEAMASRRPVLAYDWGALSELIEDGETGYLVPFKDNQAVAEKLESLCNSPQAIAEMGEKGRKAVLEKFDTSAYSRRVDLAYSMILNQNFNKSSFVSSPSKGVPIDLDQHSVKVSVIVPNYNYSKYLKERLYSVLNQTCKPMEIIFLDDASSDDSVEVAKSILSESGIKSTIIKNDVNRGVFKQWLAGVEKAKGNYIWIAEADDVADVDFLKELVSRVKQEKSVLAYCQSKVIDENGEVVREANYHHTDDLSLTRWKDDYSEIGLREVVDHLAIEIRYPTPAPVLLAKMHF